MSERDAVQGARRTATEKTSVASFGGDLPSGYVGTTYRMDRRLSEYRATLQCAVAAILQTFLK
jgi:hypothetical protein